MSRSSIILLLIVVLIVGGVLFLANRNTEVQPVRVEKEMLNVTAQK
ncbi:MAG TPA: hypothetical protein VNZ43_09180 [Sphingomonadaceae bacterium]|nr:hypothetical protein [Sphingomonadaceae bacterium]